MQNCASEILSIVGYGIDIVAIPHIKELIEQGSENFAIRCFTATESNTSITSVNRIQYLAGRFVAKEAVLKALGRASNQDCSWLDIEIQRLSTGEPSVVLYGKCQNLAATLGVEKWLVSISHTSSYAAASAIALGSIC
ncbi:MAG: holo-ACP synthase [Desmonostoc geniculatum HA4340-LM1]|jgi:holo-[acyl-carrier protein] synthase|nr:holo-ACP synthase [Desmonostoc geniculatum HA4340-LM1]